MINGFGPSSAKLAIVGEAPGQIEEQLGRPFMGPTGKLIDQFLLTAGMPRSQVYATNVVRVRPPGNNLELLYQTGYKIQDFEEILWSELTSLRPNAVIAFGNTALTALTGMKGIEKYRGSILRATKGDFKVIPTIHPASLMHKESDGRMSGWKDATFIQWDVNRAVKQSLFPEFNLPDRNLIVCRSNLELYRFLNRYSSAEYVSVDIETFHTIPICISFAFNAHEAISVPLFPGLSQDLQVSRTDQIRNWRDVIEIMANPKIQKIGQNFKFDETLLRTCLNGTLNFGIHTRGFFFDTMLGFRTLYPELPATLAFITSVLTEEPYYKEEGKGYNPKKDKIDRLLLYNAKDAVVTYECFEKELSELRERGMERFFFERVMPLHPFYSRLEQRGIRRDNFATRFLEEKYFAIWKEQQDELDELATFYGMVIKKPFTWNEKKRNFTGGCNVGSNNETGDMKTLVFVAMACPIRKGTGLKEIDALIRNNVRDEKKIRTLRLIQSIRKVRKTINTYIKAKSHPDGRLHTSVYIALETGRTSTRSCEPPITTEDMGMAFQTLTKHGEYGNDIRLQFIPDENYVFIEPDLSQAEARVVAVLARDDKLLKMFKFKVDVHMVTECWLLNIAIPLLDLFFAEENEMRCWELAMELNAQMKGLINDEQRQEGKKFRHAGHYDMGKREAASQIGISEAKAGIALNKFHDTNPNIRGVFHHEIVEFLNKNNRILTNPFGRVRQFLNKWGSELFKEGYAQIPQSTVSDQVKFAMIRIEPRCEKLQILAESHDSFLGQIPLLVGEQYPFKLLDQYAIVIKEELEQEIDFKDCSLPRGILTIPCDIHIGKNNWQEMEGYKMP